MRYVSFKDYVKAILKTAEYRKDSEMGCVVAIAPQLPGCMTQEDNFEDARESLIDAIELWITEGLKDGEDMPAINGVELADEGKNSSLLPDESDDIYYFAYSASLRIFGMIPDLDELTKYLGVVPTHTHHRGERRSLKSTYQYEHDMWLYTTPVSRSEPLHVHIDTLWETFREHKDYLMQLKKTLTVDVFLGFRSDCDTGGLEIPSKSLEIFTELQSPFGLSIIIA